MQSAVARQHSSAALLRRSQSMPCPALRPCPPLTCRITYTGTSAAVPCSFRSPVAHAGLASISSFSAASHTRIPRSRQSVRVQASWGAPVEFTPAKVLKNTPAAGNLTQLVVDVGSLAAQYTKPGQYVQIKVGDSKPGFFAIASAPDPNNAGALEFLIKPQPGATAELLCNSAEGAEIDVSPPAGKGFPVERIPKDAVSTVLLFATGTGISPVKALIESELLAEGRKQVKLYYGTRNAESTAYQSLIPAWQASGVEVVQVFSDDKQGYVQEVFAKTGLDSLPADASSVGVVLCGQKDMCQAITELLTGKGVAPEKILLNF